MGCLGHELNILSLEDVGNYVSGVDLESFRLGNFDLAIHAHGFVKSNFDLENAHPKDG